MNMENKNILIKANALVIAGDNEGFLDFCTDDTVWDFVGDRVLNGKEAVRNYMAEAYVEPPVFDTESLIADGDFVVAAGNISLKNSDGNLIKYRYCDIWKFRDGKMAEVRAYVLPV
ncbi:nuclear transport factor 2 family protein [Mucilaginibacter sp. 21P]|nr:nuclear transport factor 2 family protein [Mucilaginibacter sp. 21P]